MNSFFSFPLLSYDLKARTRNFLIWALISLCLFILIIVMFSNLLSAGLPDFLNDMLASIPSSVSNGSHKTELPNFKAIPFAKIGLYRDSWRKDLAE